MEEREAVARQLRRRICPGGEPIGRAGTSPDVRVLRGTVEEARDLFQALCRGGQTLEAPTYPGTLVELPGGGRVGFRTFSSKSPDRTQATLDVSVPGLEEIAKLKFNASTSGPR